VSIVPLPELYWREADRLRSMADAFFYAEARDEFLRIAAQFERLAREARRGTRPRDAKAVARGASPAAT
jgi:hypothetical protein